MDEDAVYYEPPIHKVVFIAGKLRHECWIEWTENLPKEGETTIVDVFGGGLWKVDKVVKQYSN